jgi:hypothetical protein
MADPKATEEDMEAWMRSGAYLPRFLRDFHRAKDAFRWVDGVRLRAIAEDKKRGRFTALEPVNWIAAHSYVIDIFLWVMAKHGYTLQRSRQRFPFKDVEEAVAVSSAEQRRLAKDILWQVMNKERNPAE